MRFSEFEDIFSAKRMQKYVQACGGDTKRAMTLYRYNLKLSQEMFTLVSCFEVALRNRIDKQMTAHLGSDWLRDLVLPGGAFYSDRSVEKTKKIILNAYNELYNCGDYSHSKLLSVMEFGVWKYLFSNVHYRLTGRVLLHSFPNKPRSSAQAQYDHNYIFRELNFINSIRNRIAHHEPICFGNPIGIDTTYALTHYSRMMTLFLWMGIDASKMLYGLDHVNNVCVQMMRI
jgi:hypothetical protein